MSKNLIYGLYKDEDPVMKVSKEIISKGVTVNDVLSPFPIHGIDPILGIKESRLHIAGFMYGLTGFTIALSFMSWVFTSNWPVIYGGKPFFSLPSFIPITFELTVLFAGVGMVISFLIVSGFYPGKTNEILDERLTDDTFAVVFDKAQLNAEQITMVKEMMTNHGAFEIHEKTVSNDFRLSK